MIPEKCRKQPQKTITAYKLFQVRKNAPGVLFSLYAKPIVEISEGMFGEWLKAGIGEAAPSGKVKSRLGELAMRPGWHAGVFPAARHIGGKFSKYEPHPNYRPEDQVWAEVEIGADVNWQAEANSRAKIMMNGEIDRKTAHITDQVPEGGCYSYKTSPNMLGEWLIAGEMRIVRILSDDEVARINAEHGVEDLPRLRPFDPEEWGFEPFSEEAGMRM